MVHETLGMLVLPSGGGDDVILGLTCRPIKIVLTDHMGFHDSGWKSDILRQSLVLGLKRPLGVSIMILGGFKGYSGGNFNLP